MNGWREPLAWLLISVGLAGVVVVIWDARTGGRL